VGVGGGGGGRLSRFKRAPGTLIDGGKNVAAITARFLEIIDKHANRLTHLIDDLLLLARSDEAGGVARAEPVELTSLVGDVAQRYPKATAAVAGGPLWTSGDAGALQRVVANLLDNAVRHARSTVSVSARADGAYQVITVTDDGPGIPVEDRDDHFAVRNGVRCAGVHLMVDLHGAHGLDDIDLIERTLRRCVDAARATLLHIHLHHFTPTGGLSGVAVLAESHISIQSWPEAGFAADPKHEATHKPAAVDAIELGHAGGQARGVVALSPQRFQRKRPAPAF